MEIPLLGSQVSKCLLANWRKGKNFKNKLASLTTLSLLVASLSVIAAVPANAAAVAADDLRVRFASLGFERVTLTASAFDRYLQEEFARWARVIKQAGIRTE